MNDRYLFRAKRIDNGEWVEGYYVRGLDMYENEVHLIFEPTTMFYSHGETDGFVEVDQSTICQYTGLKDKNGNLIWENDIVKCVDVNAETEFFAVVEFGNPNGFYSWGYQLKHIWGDESNLDILLWIDMEETGATCEIIGNIFDNPELLESEGQHERKE